MFENDMGQTQSNRVQKLITSKKSPRKKKTKKNKEEEKVLKLKIKGSFFFVKVVWVIK